MLLACVVSGADSSELVHETAIACHYPSFDTRYQAYVVVDVWYVSTKSRASRTFTDRKEQTRA